jgi:hypothetical protein
MVPLVQELIRQGVGRARGSWSALAGQAPPAPPRSLELRALGEATPPTVKVAADRAAEPMRRAGLWRAIDESGSGRGLVAVNADPAGSRTEAQSPASVGAWIASAVGGAEIRWLAPESVGQASRLPAAGTAAPRDWSGPRPRGNARGVGSG